MPPQRRSPFPQSTRSQVWLALVQWLKSDAVLHQAVDTWQVWDGSPDATLEPSEENLPLIRIEPVPSSQTWLDENTQECTWNIKVSIGVEGADITTLLDFWGAIEACLFTGNTLLNELIQYGVISKSITTPGIETRLFGGQTGVAAYGLLRIKMRIAS